MFSFLQKFFITRVLGKSYYIHGKCSQCGRCCNSIQLKKNKRWIRCEQEFIALVREEPEFGRFWVSGKTDNGYLEFCCSWFDSRKKECIDYQNRLEICRKYPTSALAFNNTEILNDCGYSLKYGKTFSCFLESEKKKLQQ